MPVLDEDEMMNAKLQKSGLDPDYWLTKFKGINATTLAALNLCGKESYSSLKDFARSQLETKILKKFLGMEFESTPSELQTPEDEMEEILTEAGLDPKKWVDEFKKVSISTPQALKQCGTESYDLLVKFAISPYEKQALRAFLGMHDEKSNFRIKQKENLEKKCKKSKTFLDDLKNLQKNSKERRDKDVKELESRIRNELHVSPEEWIPEDADLDSLVNQLQSYEDKLNATLAGRNDFDTSTELIKQVSNGQILRGVISAKDFENQKSIDFLLKAHDDLILRGPVVDPETRIETFTSLKQETSFIKNMDKVVVSGSVTAKAGLAVCVEVSVSASHTKETEKLRKVQEESTYLSTFKNSILPLASCFFSDNDLILSRTTLTALLLIEEQMLGKRPNCELQLACEEFFDKFGSHANRGPYHLGGVYWLKSYSEGFKREETEELKQFQSEALSVSIGVTYMSVGGVAKVSLGHAQGTHEGTHHRHLKSQIKLTQGQRGGPPEGVGMQLWKDGLVASNTTWAIIGQETNLTTVWDIIRINHSKDFTNVEDLVKLLSHAWERILNCLMNQKWHLYLDEMAVKLLDDVKQWLTSKNVPDCLQHVEALLKIKKQTSLNMHDSVDLWRDFFLNQSCIQCYLRWVVEVCIIEQNYGYTNSVLGVMQQILDYPDLMKVRYFDSSDRSFFIKWLYPVEETTEATDIVCTDLSSFVEFLDKKIDALHLQKFSESNQYHISKREITVQVTVAVNTLCYKHLNEKDYNSLLLLTLLLPFGYDVSDRLFRNDLTIDHLESLQAKLRKAIKVSSENNTRQCQVYLFLQAIHTHRPLDVTLSDDMLSKHIQYLINKIENLDSKIPNAIAECKQQSKYINFRELGHRLQALIDVESDQQQPINPTNAGESYYESDDEYVTCEIEPTPKNKSKIANKPKNVNVEYEQFLKTLKFDKYFPQKLTLQESLIIDASMLDNSNSTLNPDQLLFLMLEKIKMSNYNCRKVLLFQPVDKTNNDSDSDSSDEDDSDNEEELEIVIHPMDSLLALLHCSDNFLRQDLCLKLNTAQLAIPLLLTDGTGNVQLPLWSMRSIVKYWKCQISETSCVSHEGRIVDCEAPLISFMRFSHPGSYSKSSILNNVMSASKHDFFFNHECQGSSVKRKFADGVVEVCWYLPAGEKSDLFNDVITFTNLRGNAGEFEHSKQLAFLSFHSYMSFIFLNEKDISTYRENLYKLKSARGKILFLMNTCAKNEEEELKALVPNCVVIKLLKLKEPAAIVKKIQSKIVQRLSKPASRSPFCKLSTSLSSSEEFSGIKIDEQLNKFCQAGKIFAEKIMRDIKDIPPANVKERMVPLQGLNLWHKWARLDKEQNRMKSEEMGHTGLETFQSEKRRGKKEIRKNQLEKIKKKNRSPVVTTFTEVLLNESTEIRAYFLQWLKFYLDDNSREVLPDLQNKCKIAREKLRNKQVTTTSDDQKVEKIRQELKKVDDELIHASFGVEHLFRELGQMYECAMELPKDEVDLTLTKEVKTLCKVAAHLLLSGYPLEIVDGDAAHIPMRWLTAVLKNVEMLSNNSKVNVLSVLGVQSTGKSTLMNTLFGVRFAVSAGRCTRGAYFQLIKLKSIASEAKCDYMLVIDTEGLRAPELDSQNTQQHDNELAALVIGLAGVTIINIFGEVPADINDILQTTVHAFLRMKQVELKPSCQFVRHHVASVAANKSNEGSERFQRTLDEMTVLATKAEHCEGLYESFSDVITFDNKKDVQNFSSLWEGNPPMAPVNPAYCESAVKLKSKFIQSPKSPCSMHEFSVRAAELWEAVLRENFLFSFKNTLEVEAFAKLEVEFGMWSWRLQSHMFKWEKETRNTIKSSTTNIQKVAEQQYYKIVSILNEEHGKILKDLKDFFENPNSLLGSIMAQWRTRYMEKLNGLKEDHANGASSFCDTLVKKHKAFEALEEMKKNERGRIKERLKELVAEMNFKDQKELTENDIKEIENKFDQMWEEWMTTLKMKHQPIESPNLSAKILNCIRNKCQLSSHDQLICSEIRECPLQGRGNMPHLPINIDTHLNLNWKKVKQFFRQINTKEINSSSRAETDRLLTEARSSLTDLRSEKDVLYDDKHIVSVVRSMMKGIDEVDKLDNGYTFTAAYRIYMVVEVAGYALKVFTKIHEEALENHPVAYLDSLRSSFKKSFHALCTATACEKLSAMCLNELVAKRIQSTFMENLNIKLADDVKSNNNIFSSKTLLKGEVLLRLLKQGDYSYFDTYLKKIGKSYIYWIKKYTEEHCKTKREGKEEWRVIELADIEISYIITKVKNAAEKAIICSQESQDVKQWLTAFHSDLKGEITLDEDELYDMIQLQEENDLKFFTKIFLDEIELCKRRYLESFKRPETSPLLKMTKVIEETAKLLRDSIVGCCEQCPFCKEQCERTDVKHDGVDHHCNLHRPQCLGGFKYKDSREMVLDICTTDVAGNASFRSKATNGEWKPYKQYRDVYPNWTIASEERTIAPYWKWFTAKYKDDIVKSFDINPVSLSSDWTCLTSEDAEADLRKRYNLQ